MGYGSTQQVEEAAVDGTPTADMLLVSMLLNSVILTQKVSFLSLEIKNFYLNKPLKCFKYLLLKVDDIPEEIT